jgi:hypothetical protein
MAAFAVLGLLTIGVIFAFGVYWVITNVTLRQEPDRYTYLKDEDGNEYVKDLTEKEEDVKTEEK